MSDIKLIYNAAIALLSRREHSRAELKAKLERKFSDQTDAIESQLDRVEEQGYLSDIRFTEAYIHMRMKRGFGLARIKQELLYKGVEDETLQTVLCELEGDLSIEAESHLSRVWHKKFGTPPADLKQRAKQQAYLRYRGFSADDIALFFRKLDNLPT